MLKKRITYNDLDGNPITEDFYFNLSLPEMVTLEAEKDEQGRSFSERLTAIGNSGDAAVIMKTFTDLLRLSYGTRSEDGKRFIKDPQAWQQFTETDAYSQLFYELSTDAKGAAEFIEKLLPSELLEKAIAAQRSTETVPLPTEKKLKDLMGLSREELLALMQTKNDDLMNQAPASAQG